MLAPQGIYDMRTERSEAAKIKVCPQCFLEAVEH